MTPNQETQLMDACRILFPTAEVTRDFLCYIQPEGLKNAYRNRARECHPDACGGVGDPFRRTELFRRSVEAYKLLSDYLKTRKPAVIHLRRGHGTKPVLSQAPVAERAEGEQYYEGELPAIELKLGLYLYYRGVVSYQAVVRALMWQRDLRPPLGDYACRWGWLREEDVAAILRATHIVGSFGERAVALGLLSPSQLNIILLHQRSMQQPLGRYFVVNSLVSEPALRHHLRELTRHNRQVRESRP
ncbi:J domain-containing protein [Geobacter sp. FeAm09]|uniref:J domain-containing protein n=1 Tax=Geobacter sp. FeAm09 TaxID=2597769 RepID=UPI0011EC719B|nr:J domain-containing protein [Geobacter sp. FeAm09]QEM69302.1 J domain-containing protein [Geobacter sp. FeAm09]